MPDPRDERGLSIEALERAASRHWQAPDTEPLGEWLLRAADGFTGRANSALPLGDPGRPLPEAVTAVAEWYRRRGLRPMIVLPQGAAPDHLENHLNERGWLPRTGPAFVMVAHIAQLPASRTDCALPLASGRPQPASSRSALPLASGRPEAGVFPPRSSQAPRSSVQTPAAPFGSRGIRYRTFNPTRLIILPNDQSPQQPLATHLLHRRRPRPARSTSGAASRTRTATTT